MSDTAGRPISFVYGSMATSATDPPATGYAIARGRGHARSTQSISAVRNSGAT